MSRFVFASSIALLSACAASSVGAPSTAAPAPTPADVDAASTSDPAAEGIRLVVLVRHAEKASDGQDPPLTEAGKARAQCLADLLGPAAVTDVLSTNYQRTRDTVAPVAAAHGRTVEVLADADEAGWVKRLRALPPGAVAVVAGHSNTIPALVRDLTGQTVAIEHDQYDRLFVLAVEEDGGSMLAMRYCEAPGTSSHLLAPERDQGEALASVLP